MKSDKEFLEGIYEKANQYETGEVKPKGFAPPKSNKFKMYTGIAAAAVVVAVVAPSLYFSLNASHEMYEPIQDSRSRAVAPLAAALNETVNINADYETADLIVFAQVKKIDKSVYEADDDINNNMTTSITLKVNETFKGTSDSKIKVIVNGGYDQKTSNFIPYEATFKKNETTILFLVKHGDNEYTLLNSAYGKYSEVKDQPTASIFSNKYGTTVTVEDIKNLQS